MLKYIILFSIIAYFTAECIATSYDLFTAETKAQQRSLLFQFFNIAPKTIPVGAKLVHLATVACLVSAAVGYLACVYMAYHFINHCIDVLPRWYNESVLSAWHSFISFVEEHVEWLEGYSHMTKLRKMFGFFYSPKNISLDYEVISTLISSLEQQQEKDQDTMWVHRHQPYIWSKIDHLLYDPQLRLHRGDETHQICVFGDDGQSGIDFYLASPTNEPERILIQTCAFWQRIAALACLIGVNYVRWSMSLKGNGTQMETKLLAYLHATTKYRDLQDKIKRLRLYANVSEISLIIKQCSNAPPRPKTKVSLDMNARHQLFWHKNKMIISVHLTEELDPETVFNELLEVMAQVEARIGTQS